MDDDIPSGPSGNKTILIIVGIVAAVILVLILACAGLIFYFVKQVGPVMSSAMQMVNDIQLAQTTANDFLAKVGAADFEGAYKLTSTNYQKGQNLAAFKAAMEKNPALKKHTSRNMTNANAQPGQTQMNFQYQLTGPDGNAGCSLRMIKEGESWKVDQITMQ